MRKHLTLDERMIIAQHLNEGVSFKAIAAELNKKTVPLLQEKSAPTLFLKNPVLPAEVLTPANTISPVKSSMSVPSVRKKRHSLYAKTADSATLSVAVLNLTSVPN